VRSLSPHKAPSPRVTAEAWLFRRLTPDDAAEYVRLRRNMLAERPWAFCTTPEHDPLLDETHVRGLFTRDDVAVHAVDAWSGRRLLAVAGLSRMTHPMFRHRTRLWGVYVRPDSRGCGLGRAIVEETLRAAHHWEGIEFVDLGVSEDSRAALQLYSDLGFAVWGRQTAAVQFDGRNYDEIHMSRRITVDRASTATSRPAPLL
jgi:RimJ/RimL family protein N-acetyltransferase